MQEKSLLDLLSKDFKINFANSIYEALEVDLNKTKKKLNLATFNYQSGLIWDLINKKLISKLDIETTDYKTVKRGFWEFLLILDKQTNILITCMKEERFLELKRHKNSSLHYLEALILLNQELQTNQGTLFDIHQYKDIDLLKELLKKLCNDLTDNADCNHVLVTFSAKNYEISSITANVLDKNMNFIDFESWKDYINPVDINIDDNDEEVEDDTVDLNTFIGLSQKGFEKQKKNTKRNKDLAALMNETNSESQYLEGEM